MFENFFAFTETSVHWVDVSLIIAYMAGITVFGYFFSKRIKTSSDYFLAGRSLPWWIIGALAGRGLEHQYAVYRFREFHYIGYIPRYNQQFHHPQNQTGAGKPYLLKNCTGGA